MKTTHTFVGKHPTKVWNKPLHCKVPDPLLREGVARETRPVSCHSYGILRVKCVSCLFPAQEPDVKVNYPEVDVAMKFKPLA